MMTTKLPPMTSRQKKRLILRHHQERRRLMMAVAEVGIHMAISALQARAIMAQPVRSFKPGGHHGGVKEILIIEGKEVPDAEMRPADLPISDDPTPMEHTYEFRSRAAAKLSAAQFIMLSGVSHTMAKLAALLKKKPATLGSLKAEARRHHHRKVVEKGKLKSTRLF
jgi:hypothetical protein